MRKDDEIPKTKTKTNKYIRIGLARALGLEDDSKSGNDARRDTDMKAKVDWGVVSGYRFCLVCYVMFMHIGSNKSWGAFNNLMGVPSHIHVFFTLGGFSLASPMNPVVKKKSSYSSRESDSCTQCMQQHWCLGHLIAYRLPPLEYIQIGGSVGCSTK